MHNDTHNPRWPFSDLMLESQNIPLLSPAQHRSATWCSNRHSFVPICAHCHLSWPWAPLKTACLQPLCTFLSGIYEHWSSLHLLFFRLKSSSSLPGFPCRKGAPGPSSPLHPFFRLSSIAPCFSSTEESSSGHSTPDVVPTLLNTSLNLLTILCLMYPTSLLYSKYTMLAHVQLDVNQEDLRSFSARILSSQLVPKYVIPKILFFLPIWRTQKCIEDCQL